MAKRQSEGNTAVYNGSGEYASLYATGFQKWGAIMTIIGAGAGDVGLHVCKKIYEYASLSKLHCFALITFLSFF